MAFSENCRVYLALILLLLGVIQVIGRRGGHIVLQRQGTGITFSQQSYTFPVTTCAAGSQVGQVTATSTTGAAVQYIGVFSVPSGTPFSINPTTGLISAATLLGSGTTPFTITATSATGQSGSVSGTITATCSGTSGTTTTCNGVTTTTTGRTAPVFNQTSYTYSVPCSLTLLQSAGIISASNTNRDPINYNLSPSDDFYVNPSSGEVRAVIPAGSTSTPLTGTISLTATASDPWGTCTSVPVTITTTGTC